MDPNFEKEADSDTKGVHMASHACGSSNLQNINLS